VKQKKVRALGYPNPDRLSIIDPNDPKNDIAGGSKNIAAIVRVFSEAHKALQKRMAELAGAPDSVRRRASILGVILEGNYSSFRTQRAHLQKLYDNHVS